MTYKCGSFPITSTIFSHAQEIETGSDRHSSFYELCTKVCLPPDLKRSMCEAITYFTFVSRLRIHGEYLQFSTCIRFINFTIFHFLIIYLLPIIVLVSVQFKLLTPSTKIKYHSDFYEMSVIYSDMNARLHNMYCDTKKF